MDRHQLALVDVGGVDLAAVFHRRRQCQRLTAGASGKIDHLLTGFCTGKNRGKLRAFVLNFDQALAKGRLGVDRRASGIGGHPDAQPKRRPPRRLDVEMGEIRQHLLALGERVDAHIERRGSPAPPGAALIAKHPREMGSSQSGYSPCTA